MTKQSHGHRGTRKSGSSSSHASGNLQNNGARATFALTAMSGATSGMPVGNPTPVSLARDPTVNGRDWNGAGAAATVQSGHAGHNQTRDDPSSSSGASWLDGAITAGAVAGAAAGACLACGAKCYCGRKKDAQRRQYVQEMYATDSSPARPDNSGGVQPPASTYQPAGSSGSVRGPSPVRAGPSGSQRHSNVKGKGKQVHFA